MLWDAGAASPVFPAFPSPSALAFGVSSGACSGAATSGSALLLEAETFWEADSLVFVPSFLSPAEGCFSGPAAFGEPFAVGDSGVPFCFRALFPPVSGDGFGGPDTTFVGLVLVLVSVPVAGVALATFFLAASLAVLSPAFGLSLLSSFLGEAGFLALTAGAVIPRKQGNVSEICHCSYLSINSSLKPQAHWVIYVGSW